MFVEGREASVDRLVYHKVAQVAFPDAYVMPVGSIENLIALRSGVDELTNAIFGIDLFLVRDRDGLADSVVTALESNTRFRCLPRRHIENYLLDADILSEVASTFYLAPEQRDIARIRKSLQEIASSSVMSGVLWNVREHIRVHGGLGQPSVRNLDQMSRDDLAQCVSEVVERGLGAISQMLNASEIRKLVITEHARLSAALASESGYAFCLES